MNAPINPDFKWRFCMSNGKLNPVIDFINTLCNFFVLNLIFVITCIPVFTIGCALSSLYYVMGKETKGEYGYLVRTYLREFLANLKVGTLAFLPFLVTGCMILFNLLFWPIRGTVLSSGITGLLIIFSVIWLVIFHYTFPLVGRFVNTPVNSIKNAWGLALRNLKWTLALLLIDICTACFCLFISLDIVLMVFLSVGFALAAYGQSFILNKVFSPYEGKEADSRKKQSILREHADMMQGTSQF